MCIPVSGQLCPHNLLWRGPLAYRLSGLRSEVGQLVAYNMQGVARYGGSSALKCEPSLLQEELKAFAGLLWMVFLRGERGE